METFRWREIGGGAAFRAGSSLLSGPRAFPIHRHDFPEIFWVAQGRGMHWINGQERPLQGGVLVLIRPADAHGFSSDANGVLVRNIAIRPGVLAHVKRRYFLHDDTFWNGPDALLPRHFQLRADQLKQLNAAFDELSFGQADTFGAERFLLNLLHILQVPSPPTQFGRRNQPALPDWLAHALSRWSERVENFTTGTLALARLAGRSPEHVARVLRDCTGRTPTEWLNDMRMNYAAKQLQVTNRKVLDIALECGFLSLGHFYSVFQQAHGCAPRAYRMRFQPRPI